MVANTCGSIQTASLAFLCTMLLALPVPAHATELAWHSKSDQVVQRDANSERNGTVVFATGEQASVVGYSTSRAEVDGIMPWIAQYMIRFDDLSSIAIKAEGKFDRKLHMSTGSGEFLGGTGRFEGIKGKVSLVSRYSTHEAMETDWTASYSLPAK